MSGILTEIHSFNRILPLPIMWSKFTGTTSYSTRYMTSSERPPSASLVSNKGRDDFIALSKKQTKYLYIIYYLY